MNACGMLQLLRIVYDSIYYYVTMSGVERGGVGVERGSVVGIVLPSTTGGAG